ncbi:F-box protein at3g12350-like protein [Trifolium pratense]|uniref:F-box protein n=2 Tax=Trifolium pratense TaxID=57577 RepID=A0A2K3PEY9_TRIPR|nr:F-box protein at3g12350-like protein [Trifolium pratense]CAJ2675337.1 unnamed protein product [Trifolium pratense]
MAKNLNHPIVEDSLSFTDFPEDIQLCILSFLGPTEIATFACTSKQFGTLCSTDSKLWFTLCDRKWGSKTQISKWGKGKITYKHLYHTLHEWDNLIGFWRRSGPGSSVISSPSLVFFEWGESFISGSRVSPFQSGNEMISGYEVKKVPFLKMCISEDGQFVNLLDPDGRADLNLEFGDNGLNELIPVNVCFMGNTHFVLEENLFGRNSSSGEDCGFGGEDWIGVRSASGSPPDRLMLEIYQHLANRVSPGSDRSRKQRRKEKERMARRKWEPEHFVKIVNCSPTASRPLQGLWKGICADMSLAFYLVAYDEIGGIACRRLGDPPQRFSTYAPVFWTSNATFLESPFSLEEESLYDSRIHLQPVQPHNENHEQFHMSDIEGVNHIQQFQLSDKEAVNGILHINSSYDLVIADLAGAINPKSAEGRIWQYQDGTFGFGFIRDNFVIDMKNIVRDGCVVDAVNSSSD